MNCKPGDLAYLSNECVQAGVVVEVLAAVPGELPTWRCRSRTPISCTRALTGKQEMSTSFVVEDRYLRPISGVPVKDECEDEVTA
ncbi:hypothetical protein [Herbaspirillum sp. YR522]|uniref:hypothetical protein n=1 Tax=Herbaspirillum sp. YR522 TaxID=1144342 RepID=UPI00026FB35C|nr:hypothetical protein [Herbaspirillum sp. YR522]EJN07809.1 hypothetical protein PMI40_01705 [Herbaspirillum sp. YR522]